MLSEKHFVVAYMYKFLVILTTPWLLDYPNEILGFGRPIFKVFQVFFKENCFPGFCRIFHVGGNPESIN